MSHHPGPRGDFSLDVYRRGRLVAHIRETNLIVNASKDLLSHLLGGAVTNKSVTQIGYGSGSTPADVGNTSLATGAYIKLLDGVSYPGAGIVEFAFSLNSGEANGMSIYEFGLFSGDNTLYSRKVRSIAIAKTAVVSFSGAWRITF